MILIIKHIPIEGPGTIGAFFEEQNIDYSILELSKGDALPETLEGVDGVIILGGPMNVYEEEEHPHLIGENTFIKQVLEEEVPLLGICLGSQLIAKATGAQVKKAPIKEHGWVMVDQTEEAGYDPLFESISNQLIVFQWHEDTFDLPSEATLLTTSSVCKNQAFKIGKNAYGLQYHIEVDEDIIASWIRKYFKVEKTEESKDGQKMIEQYSQLKDQFHKQSEKIYANFGNIIEEYKANRLNV